MFFQQFNLFPHPVRRGQHRDRDRGRELPGVELFLAIGIVYLGLVWLMSWGTQVVERRFAIPGGH